MADPVMQLFEEYVGRFAAGEHPDLRDYLRRAGDGRDELAALADDFLQRAEAPEPDEDAVAIAQAWIQGEAPVVALRVRRGLSRRSVVERLMSRFGIADELREKMARRTEAAFASAPPPTSVPPKEPGEVDRLFFGEP